MSGQGEEQNEVEEGVGPKDQGERATDLITGDMNISTISILQSQVSMLITRIYSMANQKLFCMDIFLRLEGNHF